SPSVLSPPPPPTRLPSSSIWSATCSVSPAPLPMPRKASPHSSRGGRRTSRDARHEAGRRKNREGQRRRHVGGRSGEPRHGHEGGGGGTRPRRPVDDRDREHGQRTRLLPRRLHLLPGRFSVRVRLQLPRPTPRGPAVPDR